MRRDPRDRSGRLEHLRQELLDQIRVPQSETLEAVYPGAFHDLATIVANNTTGRQYAESE